MGSAKEKIEAILNLFPECVWDRFSGELDGWLSFFGWISRKDNKKDFLILEFAFGKVSIMRTSSAEYSAEFAKRLGFNHHDCQRVEDHFGGVKCIKLKK